MTELLLIFSFFALGTGILTLGRLALLYRQDKTALRLATLAFFAAFSFLMIVSALFAYVFSKLTLSPVLQRTFVGLIIIAMASLELSLPWLIAERQGKKIARKNRALIGATASLTLLQAPLVMVDLLGDLIWLAIGIAFLLFIPLVLWSLLRLGKPGTAPPNPENLWPGLAGVLVPVLLAFFDLWQFYLQGPHQQFISLCLPATYVQTAWYFSQPALGKSLKAPDRGSVMLSAELAATLTPREVDMARLILEGLANKEIAQRLSLSENTVRNHIYNLYQKLGIQKRMDLVALCGERDEQKPG